MKEVRFVANVQDVRPTDHAGVQSSLPELYRIVVGFLVKHNYMISASIMIIIFFLVVLADLLLLSNEELISIYRHRV